MKKLPNNLRRYHESKGYALIVVMMMSLAMGLALATYHAITAMDLATLRSSARYEKSFYSAEGALNARAEEFRQMFSYFHQPSGTSPATTAPCSAGNMGVGDFACKNYSFGNDTVRTYVISAASNPTIVTIPQGEAYAGLSAAEFQYDLYATAVRPDGSTGSMLGLRFKSRAVPMFQFAAFYYKDLEVTPIEPMTLGGPVHANGNLYLNTSATLNIFGQITAVGSIFRGRKHANDCYTGTIRVANQMPDATYNPAILTSFGVSSQYNCGSGGTRANLGNRTFSQWNGMIQQHVQSVEVPSVTELDPTPGSQFWDLSDLRLALRLDSAGNPVTTNSPTGIEVRTQAGAVHTTMTQKLNRVITSACSGPFPGNLPVGYTRSMENQIEGGRIMMFEIDVANLLKCIHDEGLAQIDNVSEGGLVMHFSVDGPFANVVNRYAIRLRNGSNLSVPAAPAIKGLTIVTNQALYIYGNYNTVNKKPASIVADSLNILSAGWQSDPANQAIEIAHSTKTYTNRTAVDNTVYAAFVAATITTGGQDYSPSNPNAGQNQNPNSAGVNNYARLHENWTGDDLVILGSFVSLGKPRYSNGTIISSGTGAHFSPPNRAFNFDLDFNNPLNLPPISLSFVYLKQILFSRNFEQ